jgi:choline dehydrogenase
MPNRHVSPTRKMSLGRFDYVIVGAGAAGCAVAGRLAARAGCRVALIEAGGGNHHPLTRIPGTAFLASVSPARNWNFETEPVAAIGGQRMRWNQGRLVGGSSSINGMLYMRGHSREYDRWRALGCDGWGFEDVLRCYRRSESSSRGANRWHGGDGPIPTRPSNATPPICAAFLEAARESGFPVVDDLNADVEEGFGRFDVNIRGGRRVSAATGYLSPIKDSPGFTLITDALALRVRIDGSVARGVEVLRKGRVEQVSADREVIVCGGAINSPHLLMLSGIGPAAHLESFGIPVVADRPEVGSNLRNHPAYSLRFACNAPVSAYGYLRPATAAGLMLRYALGSGGPLGESYVAQGGVFRTDPGLEFANSIVVMSPALVTRGGAGQRWRDLFPDREGFAVSVSLGRPASRGTIRLNSANPTDHPAIQPNFLAEPEDVKQIVQAVRRIREMMHARAIRDVIERELSPGDIPAGDAALETEIRARLGTYSHPSGTCRMGSDEGSVLDPALRVRGVEGLRVADASIMPTPLNACTHGPAIMIGEMAAELLLQGDVPRRPAAVGEAVS